MARWTAALVDCDGCSVPSGVANRKDVSSLPCMDSEARGYNDSENAGHGTFTSCQPRGWLEAQLLGPHPGRRVVIPGAWAMGEGLVLDIDDSVRRLCSCTATSTATSTADTASHQPCSCTGTGGKTYTGSGRLPSSLSRMAEDWTASVGCYLSDVAAALTGTGGCNAAGAGVGASGAVRGKRETAVGPAEELDDHHDLADDCFAGGDFCSCIVRLKSRKAAVAPSRSPRQRWRQTGHQKAD